MTRMGADVQVIASANSGGEQIGTLRVRPSQLRAARVTEAEVPSLIDELPLLACVAAGAGIGLEITGAAELRVKESDRISTVVKNLRAVGALADELPDGLRVHASHREFAGTIDPRGDHRIAMAFGILSAVSGNRSRCRTRVRRRLLPGFWEDLHRVAP
jgi:3-phosphoshikimate 1-carboxyvinyltransferase